MIPFVALFSFTCYERVLQLELTALHDAYLSESQRSTRGTLLLTLKLQTNRLSCDCQWVRRGNAIREILTGALGGHVVQ